MFLLSSADFFSNYTFSENMFQEHYQSVKPFGARSGGSDMLSVLICV